MRVASHRQLALVRSSSLITVVAAEDNFNRAHVGCTYIVTLVIYYFVWTNYDQMVKLRWQWFRSDEYQNSMHSRSLLVHLCPQIYSSISP